jgi:hypothetical protein
MSHFAKRHYEAIALVLQDTQPPKENEGILGYDDQVSQWENCRDALADMFRRDNQRFQYDRRQATAKDPHGSSHRLYRKNSRFEHRLSPHADAETVHTISDCSDFAAFDQFRSFRVSIESAVPTLPARVKVFRRKLRVTDLRAKYVLGSGTFLTRCPPT